MDVQPEVDPNFEPQTRARSNTWPCRPHEVIVDAQCSPASDESTSENAVKPEQLGLKTKTSSRRNAWGNLSYADLITKAIHSSSEQRLTLSQIYDWMVQNVPYFKDKGDNTSSAGWKNSIRHNLSLHSRFMRIQNEGTGKSSWWVINPDAKPGKTPRRRAGSMETKSYEKRRGRVKKKVEALRQALENNNSPSSATEDYLNDSSLFQLSPEFRQRTSSNASSCGRLSPIQAGIEPDLHDNQVPPMSPIPWGSEENSNISYDQLGQYDQLVDTLVDGMKLGDSGLGLGPNGGRSLGLTLDQNDIEMLAESNSLQQQILGESMNNVNMSQFNDQSANYDEVGQYQNMPPPYSDALRRSPQQQTIEVMSLLNGNYGDNGIGNQGAMQELYGNQSENNLYSNDSLNLVQQMRMSPASSQLSVNTQQQQQQQQQLASPARSPQNHQQISPNYRGGYVNQNSPQNKELSPQLVSRQPHHVQTAPSNQRSLLQQCLEAPPESLLRAALTQKPPSYQMPPTTQQTPQYNPPQYGSAPLNMPLPMNMVSSTNGMNSKVVNNNVTSSTQQTQQHLGGGGILGNLPQMSNQSSQLASSLPSGQNISQQNPPISQVLPGGRGMPPNPSSNSLNEIDPDFFDLGCDVEQVLQHELSLEGNLDFNFDPVNSATSSTEAQNMVR